MSQPRMDILTRRRHTMSNIDPRYKGHKTLTRFKAALRESTERDLSSALIVISDEVVRAIGTRDFRELLNQFVAVMH